MLVAAHIAIIQMIYNRIGAEIAIVGVTVAVRIIDVDAVGAVVIIIYITTAITTVVAVVVDDIVVKCVRRVVIIDAVVAIIVCHCNRLFA